MAFRNQNRNRNFGSNYGGPMGGNNPNRGNMNISPWEGQNTGGNFGGGGNMRQGQGMNAQAINLANNLLNNLFRNQNPPSLLDLPRGGNMGNRGHRGLPMVNRGGGPGNRLNNNRRAQGGFQNRNGGSKTTQKPASSGGIRKQNAFDRAKKLLAKNANNKKKDTVPGDKKIESKESPYDSVPNDMFYCHLCKKHMWDANSFENHIKGRTHLMMREGIEESYRLKANMIRQEAKIAEQLKSIELDRLKRMGKSKQRQLDYCTMCDLNFHGHISAHRKSDGHLQLKKFLHPKCNECNKEFATRIDYDTHLLSADHLKKAAEKNTKVGERKRQTLMILTEEEELKDVRPPQKKKRKVVTKNLTDAAAATTAAAAAFGINEIKKESEEGGGDGEEAEVEEQDKKDGEEEGGDEAKEDDMNETFEEEEVALPVDPEDCILAYKDGDEIPTEVDSRLPKYNWTRPVGANLITKLECYECSLCAKFFDTEKTVEVHSRTVGHHRNFLKFINEKSNDTKIAQKRAAAALEESERKKRKMEEAENSVNGEGENAEHDVDGALAGEGDGDGELYDPSEATGDDDDIDMTGIDEGEDYQDNENGMEMELLEEDEKNVETVQKENVGIAKDIKTEPELMTVYKVEPEEIVIKEEIKQEIKQEPDVVESATIPPVKADPIQSQASAPAPASTPTPTPTPAPATAEAPTSVSAPAVVSNPTLTSSAASVSSTPASAQASAGQTNAAGAITATATPTPTPTLGATTTATPTSTPTPTPSNDATPTKKVNPVAGRGGGNAKGSPRNRGRGRYNRY